MSSEKILDLSESFVLSSGTVCFDIEEKRVLLLNYRPKNEILLPKGRKDRGESLEIAAVRETYEESGFQCQLLPHSLHTNAQAPASREHQPHTEPIAVQQRIANRVRKIIFWYLAQSDPSKPWTPGTQDEGEDFESRWVPVKDALDIISNSDDRLVLKQALKALDLQE